MIRTGAVLFAVMTLAACQPEPFGRSTIELRDDRRQCEAEGGRFERGGLTGALMCFQETPDAGAACTKGTDCSGLCLANADGPGGACSSVRPLFGCHEMFDERGEKVVICID
ncbi:hypothetical protein EI983_14340 [Roseovarius faecimaris]|uniref:Lipoprotein n=1 Tax=Roseovarius faecimaris TaxID=2494550 RepID=A0A6I6IV37_9RHOB|nr:hypothetical protein [Roseovarius faecimaris]QGX99377.1 hypothetical protein EI983_14340 [Roseovarius faecimaris]